MVRGLSSSEGPAVFKTKILNHSISFSEQVLEENIKYVIKWNFDLDGGTVSIPAGCILDFDGGSLANGTVEWNETKVLNRYRYQVLDNITETGEKIEL